MFSLITNKELRDAHSRLPPSATLQWGSNHEPIAAATAELRKVRQVPSEMNQLFEALAHPTRRDILELLKKGSMTAGDIAGRFEVSKPTMSAHFAKLRDAGLIHGDKNGTSITYSLNLSVLEEVLLGFVGRMGIATEVRKTDE